MTCLRFPADLREQEVQLYLPTQLSDPTASHYRQQIEPVLVELAALAAGPLVILLPEGPLRSHLGTFLAAQFGSRVGIHRLQPPPTASPWPVGNFGRLTTITWGSHDPRRLRAAFPAP